MAGSFGHDRAHYDVARAIQGVSRDLPGDMRPGGVVEHVLAYARDWIERGEQLPTTRAKVQPAAAGGITIERPRMRLTLRRSAGGGWTYEAETLAEPSLVSAAAPGPAGQDAGALPPAPAPVRADLVAIHPPPPGAVSNGTRSTWSSGTPAAARK